MMYRKLEKITLSEEERGRLISIARRATSTQREALRARIILAAAEGATDKEIALRLGIANSTAFVWRRRFSEYRIAGLEDGRRTGAPRRISDKKIREVIWLTLKCEPPGGRRWSQRSMAEASGLTSDAVARIWKFAGLKPHRERHFEALKRALLMRDDVGLRELAELNGVTSPRAVREHLTKGTVTVEKD